MEEHTEEVSQTPTPVGGKVSKKAWIIIGVVGVGLLIVSNMFSPERMTERAVEQAFEEQGIDADINTDGDGSVNYTVTGENGENIQMQAGEDVSLPDGWPSNIPLVDDAQITYAGTVAGNEGDTNYMVSYQTTDSLTDIVSFYSDAFKANGWSTISNVATGDSIMLGTEYGENGSVAVYAVKDAEGVAVTLTVGAK